jgi:signal peptidase I
MLEQAPLAPLPEEQPVEESPRTQRFLSRRVLVDVLRTSIEALFLFLVISMLTGRCEIHQVSMEPNLHEGQRVIVSKIEKIASDWFAGRAEAAEPQAESLLSLHRGQIVVLYKSASRDDDPLIKRVIGLPGDTVEIRDGEVYVNGEEIYEPYTYGKRTNCGTYCRPIALGPDQYWVMGDNRPNSLDSRSFGPVSGAQIVGRVVVRYWPLDQLALYP